jgi:hypothetical protein
VGYAGDVDDMSNAGTSPAEFSVRLLVRSSDLDWVGHVNHVAYHQFGEHARIEITGRSTTAAGPSRWTTRSVAAMAQC